MAGRSLPQASMARHNAERWKERLQREGMAFAELAISHELRQPLSIIMLIARNIETLATAGAADAETVRSKMAQIRRNVQRAQRLVRGLSAFANGAGERQPFATAEPIVAALEGIEPRLRTLQIACQIEPLPDAVVLGSPILFQQVFANLFDNALDAIESRAAADETAPRRITVSGSVARGRAVWRVADTGGGVAAEDLARIFDPLFTTKPYDKGMGMGLCLCRAIVEDMGGTIMATNDGHGLMLTVDLPLTGLS